MRARLDNLWPVVALTGVLLGAGAADAGAQAEPPARIHVALFPDRALSEPDRLSLEAELVAGVRAAGVTQVTRTERPAVDNAALESTFATNDQAADEVRRRLNELEVVNALNLLDWAVGQYSTYLPELVARDGNPARLVELLKLKAIAHYLNGEEAAASDALRQALILDPTIEFDPTVFPPQLEGFVRRERRIARAAGTSRIRINAGAYRPQVYVNGRALGRAPQTARDVPVGPNLVHIRQPGAAIDMRRVQLRAQRRSIRFELDVAPAELIGPLAGARSDVGREQASQALYQAARALDVDGLVLVLARSEAGTGLELEAYVYDMRTGDRVGRFDTRVSGAYDRAAKVLGQQAVEDARWRPLVENTAPVVVASSPPLWRRAYFWTAVGATAGVLAIGAVVASQSGLSNGQRLAILPLISF